MHCRAIPLVLVMIVLAVGAPNPAHAQPGTGVQWKTGEAFDAQLRLVAGVTWREMPLRQGLDSLARANQVCIWLDRRVDPDRKIDFASSDLPLEQMIEKLAKSLDMSSVRVGSVVYVGPGNVQRLGTLAAVKRQEAETLSGDLSRRMANMSAADWDDLAEPRKLIENYALQCGLRSFYLETVQHDLWPARNLPRMHAADLLTILLAGFDMSFEFSPDRSAIRPIEIPLNVVLVRQYAYQGDLSKAMAKIRDFFPGTKLSIREGKLHVAGTQAEHREIARLLSGQTMRRTITQPGTKVYSLEVQGQPVGAIVLALGKQLGRKVEFDPEISEDDLTQAVSFTVKDNTLPQLLEAALKPVGLGFELTSDMIKVHKLK